MLETLNALVVTYWPQLLLIAAVSYLIGSVNFAILVTRAFSHKDIRDVGSGNAGMTNVLRSQGKLPALFTTFGDLGKSIVSVLLAVWIIRFTKTDSVLAAEQAEASVRYLAGLCCVLGHMFPVYFGFRGGKGVLAAFGMLLMVDWKVALIVIAIFIVVLLCSHMVSLSSLTASASAVVLTWVFDRFVYQWDSATVLFCTLSTAIIVSLLFIMHRSNIGRIIKGTEHKFAFGKTKKGE